LYQYTNLCFCLYLCYRLLIIAWNAKLLWWACLHMVRLEQSHSTFDRREVNADLRFIWIRYSIMLLGMILLVVPVFVQANSICVWCFKLLICLMFAGELGIKWEDFDVIINTRHISQYMYWKSISWHWKCTRADLFRGRQVPWHPPNLLYIYIYIYIYIYSIMPIFTINSQWLRCLNMPKVACSTLCKCLFYIFLMYF